MGTGYVFLQRSLTAEPNGQSARVRANANALSAMLRKAATLINSDDTAYVDLGVRPAPGQPIEMAGSQSLSVEADGDVVWVSSPAKTVREALSDAGILLLRGDRVLLDGLPVHPAVDLPSAERSDAGATTSPSHGTAGDSSSIALQVERSVPLLVQDGPTQIALGTTARTVGRALLENAIAVYRGDRVFPDLDTPLQPDMRVFIQRSTPVALQADGESWRTRTFQKTVGGLLDEVGISLGPKDYTIPSEDEYVEPDLSVRVVRVSDQYVYEDSPIEYVTVWRPDPGLELDHRTETQSGTEGTERRRFRVRYEDSEEMYRVEEERWIAVEPSTRVIAYGTKIVERELQTPDGAVRYWRRIRVLVTSYTAATSGKTRDHPAYGITRLGWRARTGLIAVDPRVISLRTDMYVPGYGLGTAADTGGAIKWRHIDLCYDEDSLKLWRRWVDVYLISPPPPRDRIRWIVPDWPKER